MQVTSGAVSRASLNADQVTRLQLLTCGHIDLRQMPKVHMSRVGRCIDNGPMEGFWGILKRECYYGHTFTSREQLISTIESYIDYYNNRRYQHRLFIQTPMQAHVSAMNRAA